MVDREASDASRGRIDGSGNDDLHVCVPYEWNWSQDVEKCTLDLVVSSSTHTDTVQAIAAASTGARFFHQTLYLCG